MKLKFFLFLFLCLASAKIFSQWNLNPAINVSVSSTINNQQDARIVTDTKDGAIITWVDYRNNSISGDIFAQRMNDLGYPLWPSNGVPICTNIFHQSAVAIASSGFQNAIITWQDARGGDLDIYAQKVDALGNSLWTTNGIAVCVKTSFQQNPKIISDQLGGAIIIWEDSSGGSWDIFAQHINSLGIALWPSGGVVICNDVDAQINPKVIPDNANGAIVVWQDKRNGLEYTIFAQRIDSTGTVLWTTNGVNVCNIAGGKTNPKIEIDGAGGAYIAWQDKRTGVYDIYAQRLNASGTLQWASSGVVVCNSIGSQSAIDMTTAFVSGAIISWKDNRSGIYKIYASMISPTGSIPWTTNGILIASGINPNIIGDTFGGAIIAWQDSVSAGGTWNVYSQRLNSSGVKQWTVAGVPIATANGGQSSVKNVSTSTGGSIYCWQDKRNTINLDIYAHALKSNGTIPVGINSISKNLSTTKCFPNPFDIQGTITINFNTNLAPDKLLWEVYNETGQVIFSQTTENTNQLNIDGSKLNNGVYLYHVSNTSQMFGNGSFIVLH